MLYFFIGHCSDVEKESTASSMPRFICCGLKRKVRTLFSLIMTINCNRARRAGEEDLDLKSWWKIWRSDFDGVRRLRIIKYEV